MRARGDYLALVRKRLFREQGKSGDCLRPYYFERLVALELFDALGEVAARHALVDVLKTGEAAKFLDARLDVVAGDFFALVNLVDSDVVFYSLVGVNSLLGNVEAELLLGFHDRNPQVAFEKYFSFGAPNLFYFF